MDEESKVKQILKKKAWVIIGAIILFLIIAIIIIFQFNTNKFPTSRNDSGLASQLETEQDQIIDSFKQRFSFLKNTYNIDKVILIKDSNHAVILLTLDLTKYKALLVKNNDTWSVKGLPSAALSYDDFADIPRDIVKYINDLEVY